MAGQEEILEHLQGVGDRDFELFLADLWEHLGWNAQATQVNGDRGVDVVATRNSPVPLKMVLQAKRYSPGSKVSSTEVQQYGSLKLQQPDVDVVAVVTTGAFTEQALEEAKALNVKTLDGNQLADLVERETAHIVLDQYADGKVVPRPDPDIIRVDAPRGGWAEAELENHVVEGYGLHDTIPGLVYERGEELLVAHSSNEPPKWRLNGEVASVTVDTNTAENGPQVFLHLTNRGLHVFARKNDRDEHVYIPYDGVVDVISDSPLFGSNESVTFQLENGETVEYSFQSMAAEIRGRLCQVLEEKVGCTLTL